MRDQMPLVKTGLAVLLVLAPCGAVCRERTSPPSFTMIGASKEASVLSMKCSGKPPFKNLSCDFDQLSVSKAAQDDINRSLEETKKQIKAPNFREEMLAFCKPVFDKKWDQEQKEEISNTWDKARPLVQRIHEYTKNSCECFKKNNFQDCFLKVQADAESERLKLCQAYHFRFSVDLVKVSENIWISEAKPTGSCNVVTVIKIEDETGEDYKWVYTQTRAAVGSKAKECIAIKEGTTASYSWKNPKLWSLGCENITFSP